MTINYRKTILSILAIMVGICASAPIPANAVDDNSGDKVYPSISPIKTHAELEPGEVYTDYFQVGNNGTELINYKIYADPYQETDENGSVNYSERNNYTQIVDWISFDVESGTVAPGELDKITYTVKVPENAPGGGQYAALVVEAKNDEDSGGLQINTITRVASILYAQVSGETDSCANIVYNKINTFTFKPPITADSIVESCGNIDLEAKYVINVYNIFGGEMIYSTEEEPLTKNILPGTRRFNTASWTAEEGAPSIGIYDVEQIINIGSKTDTVRKTVLILPLMVIIVVSLFLASLVFWLVFRARQHKESKRSSASKSSRSSSDTTDKSTTSDKLSN